MLRAKDRFALASHLHLWEEHRALSTQLAKRESTTPSFWLKGFFSRAAFARESRTDCFVCPLFRMCFVASLGVSGLLGMLLSFALPRSEWIFGESLNLCQIKQRLAQHLLKLVFCAVGKSILPSSGQLAFFPLSWSRWPLWCLTCSIRF